MLSITFLSVSNNSWTSCSIAIFISGYHGCDLPFDLWSLDCQFCIVTGVLSALQQTFLTAVEPQNFIPSVPNYRSFRFIDDVTHLDIHYV
jgi:hypothetical protein